MDPLVRPVRVRNRLLRDPVDAAGPDRWNRPGGSIRTLGGTALFTAGYWSFFERTESDDRALAEDVGAGRKRLRWDEWLLLGTLGLQVVLELLVYAEVMPVPWFQVLYSVQMFVIGVLTVRVALKLVART